MRKLRHVVSATLLAAAIPLSAVAGTVDVYVGYADGIRTGADFPNPFAAAASFGPYTVANFVADLSTAAADTGAVMLVNTGATSVTINNLDVNDRANGLDYQIWTGLGAGQLGSGITLAPNTAAIFAQNSGNNFDSSDFPSAAFIGAAQTGTTFDATSNNCSTGAIAASAACTSSYSILTFTLNGSTSSIFNDTAHVLDTGGFDSAGYSHLHTGGSGVPTFNTNESLNWRLIGTTGINDPGGGVGVPEPATLGLLSLGLAGIGFARRKRKS